MTSSSSYLIGMYLVLNGGLYVLNGAGAAVIGAMVLPSIAWLGVVLIVVGMGMLVAGGGVIVERGWARYLAIALLGLDVLEKAVSVYAGAVLEVIWLALSLGAVGILLFANPYDSVPRPDLDEDRNVHSLGNLRR